MRNIFLITGFSQWGKSTIISTLFSGRKKFYYGKDYDLINSTKSFTVQSQSNDDLNIAKYIKTLNKRIARSKSNAKNLIAAFCPTIPDFKGNNDSKTALKFLRKKGYRIHIIYLLYRWDNHAQLMMKTIKKYYGKNIKLQHIIISSKNLNSKIKQVIQYINSI